MINNFFNNYIIYFIVHTIQHTPRITAIRSILKRPYETPKKKVIK